MRDERPAAPGRQSLIGRVITIVPANEASWDDIQAVLGKRGDPARCQCQRYKIFANEWRSVPVEERIHRFREQTDCGQPDADGTAGLVAYVDGEPAGWCAVEPRSEYPQLWRHRIVNAGRAEDPADDSVWAITCFVIRAGYRRHGLTYALAEAAVEFARERGARAVEAYPMDTFPDQEITWGELHVGARKVFAAAGFAEVTHPTKRRYVMRIEL